MEDSIYRSIMGSNNSALFPEHSSPPALEIKINPQATMFNGTNIWSLENGSLTW
jgi:hypothetical protein